MRVYLTPPTNLSRAMFRVSDRLKAFAPEGIQIVKDRPDLAVLHVIDSEGVPEIVDQYLDAGVKVAIIQYCIDSARNSDRKFWKAIWEKCELVWSYYDLPDAPRFYKSPLGTDHRGSKLAKSALAISSGYVPASECLEEVAYAVAANGQAMFHVGPELGLPGDVQYYYDISDLQLSKLYSMSHYVTGLRRCEGFELPLAEGLVCGARPVTFDRPHYRAWFSEFAEFIPEGSPTEVAEALKVLFSAPPRAVSDEEIALARKRFNWETICKGFWERVA